MTAIHTNPDERADWQREPAGARVVRVRAAWVWQDETMRYKRVDWPVYRVPCGRAVVSWLSAGARHE